MTETTIPKPTVRYRITGMDCSACAAKIEGAVRKVPGVATRTSRSPVRL